MSENHSEPIKGDSKPDSHQQETEQESLRFDDEIRGLLEAASEDTQPQFEFPEEETEEDIPTDEWGFPEATQDPEKAHRLFYDKKQAFLRENLPPGDEHSEARKTIRDEITLFLNEGATSGRDSRQTHFYLYRDAFNMMQDWLTEGGQDLVALHNAFYQANFDRGFRKP